MVAHYGQFSQAGENPVKASIPVFLWSEAVLRGHEMTAAQGVIGATELKADIKLIYAVATNCLINQHADINRSAEILKDETKVEFFVVQDNFLTSTAKFADVVLPACTQFETWGVEDGWKYGDEVILQPKLIEPLDECKSDYRICADLAEHLGFGEAYTEGRDERGWVDWCLDRFRETRFPDLPSLDTFIEQNLGAYSKPVLKPAVAFADFRDDPEKYPLKTPSGKIEIFSKTLYEMGKPDEIPAVPKYIPEWENPFPDEGNKSLQSKEPGIKKYPLQALGHHSLARVHSTHANNDWLQEAFPQQLCINPVDARPRGISDGDLVHVWNERGELVIHAHLTNRILPGVVDIPQGAWWNPNADGVDQGGNINVLTSHRWTPLAFGSTQHTIMVEVEKSKPEERSRLPGKP